MTLIDDVLSNDSNTVALREQARRVVSHVDAAETRLDEYVRGLEVALGDAQLALESAVDDLVHAQVAGDGVGDAARRVLEASQQVELREARYQEARDSVAYWPRLREVLIDGQ